MALIGAGVHLRGVAPGELTDEGLGTMLGRASGASVLSGRIVWEPSGGFWSDTFHGRRVLFLAGALLLAFVAAHPVVLQTSRHS